ncbi:hypothetical protein JTE90_012903 [Oedothorax gibbosus]|uniref:Equilibrative nucleoside transporter 4 n=1 Tax=Oedothorax gibbosus TaxID=931172 RepID=A0AAV6U1X3_9ARAC|nr:hypothetical protein JTE90_012903 [Oedothorax gibbosus]
MKLNQKLFFEKTKQTERNFPILRGSLSSYLCAMSEGGYIELDRDRPCRKGDLSAPRDTCQGVYLGLLLTGIGFLLPYNSFIIAVDYFQAKYPGTTIVFDMSLVYILVALLAVLINNLLVEALTLHARITFGYVVSLATLLHVALFEIWMEVFDLWHGYFVNLLAVAFVSFGCTVQQSSFYGYTSMLPSRYTQAVMTGESAAGLLVSLNRIVTKLLLRDERLNTLIFFCASLGCVALCCTVHRALARSPFVLYHLERCQQEPAPVVTLEPTEDVGLVDMLEDQGCGGGRYGVLSLRSPPPSPENEDPPSTGTTYRVQEVVVKVRRGYTRNLRWWASAKRGFQRRWSVCQEVWPMALCICLAYLVTLSLFPGIESEVLSCAWGSWMPVLIMAAFNLADCVGKVLASVPFPWSSGRLLLLCVLRVCLVPLLAMCAGPRGSPYLSGETWPLLLSLALGLTNGLAGSLPMILAPRSVQDDHKELTALDL